MSAREMRFIFQTDIHAAGPAVKEARGVLLARMTFSIGAGVLGILCAGGGRHGRLPSLWVILKGDR